MADEYHAYLASREWALKREAVRRRSGNKCERCHLAPQQAVNHLTYENLYNEPLEDLQAICHPCHAFLSAKSDVDPIANITMTSEFQRQTDAHLTVSVRREAICECCGFVTEGSHIVCPICKRIACAACTFLVVAPRGSMEEFYAKSHVRCVDHAETL